MQLHNIQPETIYLTICTVTFCHALSVFEHCMFLIQDEMHPYIDPYTLLHISVSKLKLLTLLY